MRWGLVWVCYRGLVSFGALYIFAVLLIAPFQALQKVSTRQKEKMKQHRKKALKKMGWMSSDDK